MNESTDMKPDRRKLLIGSASMAVLPLVHQSSSNSPVRKLKVAVFGAGSFGGWTAYNLQTSGCEVTLVDPWGGGNSRSSSGGESRVIRSVYGADEIYTKWVKRSAQWWSYLEKASKQKLHHSTGVLWMFNGDDSYMKKSIPIAAKHDFKVDELTLDELSKRYPQIRIDGIKSAYYEHFGGHLLARRCCASVVELFADIGGTVIQSAIDLKPEPSRALGRVKLTNGQFLHADHFVFALGPWLGRIFPETIGARVSPTRQEVYYFGVPRNDQMHRQGKLPIWVDFDKKLYYGIPGTEHRGFKVADDSRGEKTNPTTMNRIPKANLIAEARAFLAQRFPKIKDSPLLESRVCQYENSPDGHLIIDHHPDAENVWLVGGGSGHGFKLSPAVGEHVAERIMDKRSHEKFFELARLANFQGGSKTQFDADK